MKKNEFLHVKLTQDMSNYNNSAQVEQVSQYATSDVVARSSSEAWVGDYERIIHAFRVTGIENTFQEKKTNMKIKMPWVENNASEIRVAHTVLIMNERLQTRCLHDAMVIRPVQQKIVEAIRKKRKVEEVEKYFTIAFVPANTDYVEYKNDFTSVVISADGSKVRVRGQFGGTCDPEGTIYAPVPRNGYLLCYPINKIVNEFARSLVECWNSKFDELKELK